jgi:photosystem II stability/assembly factor-like uncharacterized protein
MAVGFWSNKVLALGLLLAAPALHAYASPPWVPFGPDGGDARRIAADPQDTNHLFLGTANGWLYESHNNGVNWLRVARVGQRDDLVLDSIVVDPKNPQHLIVGAWTVDLTDGGIFISNDGGKTWRSQAEMRGQAVLSMAVAPANAKMLVAGTRRGVFRSEDDGAHWAQISPEDSVEIHNIQSVAIDPKNPQIIYAGTWHLPWRTKDGGEHWEHMKEGIIDDSDVFSILVDPVKPKIVYVSACSGIYKSEDGSKEFHKIQGIPATARRTRRLLQDPNNLDIVFAGTTEGLFRSLDAGRTWSRTTGPEIIVNDIEVDARNSKRVLLATDRGGVLSSDDGGDTFHDSNNGFSARQVTALERDRQHPATLYIGVVNDKDWGGVFESENGGVNWTQRSAGLAGRDVFALGQAPNGTVIAGTAHGLFRLDQSEQAWIKVEDAPAGSASGTVERPAEVVRGPVPMRRGDSQQRSGGAQAVTTTHTAAGKTAKTSAAKRKPAAKPAIVVATGFDGSVFAIATSGNVVLASTSVGLLTSATNGETWQHAGPRHSEDWRFLAAAKANVVGGTFRSIQFSADSGAHWTVVALPEKLMQISALAVEPSGAIWAGGREGVFVTTDGGQNWIEPKGLFFTSVNSLYFDESSDRMLVTTTGPASYVFTVQLPQRKVTFAETGWSLRFARPLGDHLVAATLFDGIVVQPRMMASPLDPKISTKAATLGTTPPAP